jgi:excisionase family DNA binding protein
MSDHDPLQLLTVKEVATVMQVKPSWIYDMVEEKKMPVVRLGRQLRFRRGDLDNWLTAMAE